jgi:hypothetical protein
MDPIIATNRGRRSPEPSEPEVKGLPQGSGSGGQLTATGQQGEKGAVTFVCRPTPDAARQVTAQGQHLFRLELAVQIFPETADALQAFHSP